MARESYRYSALVNGQRRSVRFIADPEEWGHEPIEEGDGTTTPACLNLATAELLIFNDEPIYRDFYMFATQADYDAERTDARLERLIPARWEVIE